MDAAAERRFVRAIVRQVHPDLFAAHPYERSKNSEALKVRRAGWGVALKRGASLPQLHRRRRRLQSPAGSAQTRPPPSEAALACVVPGAYPLHYTQTLNVYADELSQGLLPQAGQVTFYVRQGEGEGLRQVCVGTVNPVAHLLIALAPERLPGRQPSCASARSIQHRYHCRPPPAALAGVCGAARLRLARPSVLCLWARLPGGAATGSRGMQRAGWALPSRLTAAAACRCRRCFPRRCLCIALVWPPHSVPHAAPPWLPGPHSHTLPSPPLPSLLLRPAAAGDSDRRDLAAWLRETVAAAVSTADQHDAMKRVIRELRMGLEARFGLASIQVGGRFRGGCTAGSGGMQCVGGGEAPRSGYGWARLRWEPHPG